MRFLSYALCLIQIVIILKILIILCSLWIWFFSRGNVDKKEALENLDLILLCIDEIVDGGYTTLLLIFTLVLLCQWLFSFDVHINVSFPSKVLQNLENYTIWGI